MDLRLGSCNGDHDYRSTFTLERARGGEWFDYFYEQFVLAWKTADPA
ncbi:hypothetical protein [Actinomadura terrae]|nr:hypothetical protein [Actinomadura terrae]